MTIGNEISCTILQLPPEPLIRGLSHPDPCSVCPQLNLLNPPRKYCWIRNCFCSLRPGWWILDWLAYRKSRCYFYVSSIFLILAFIWITCQKFRPYLTENPFCLPYKKKTKIVDVRITQHWGALFQSLLQRRSYKYCIFYVCVCSLKYPGCKGHTRYSHLWSVRLYNIFFTLLHKKVRFSKKKLNIKCVFLFSLQIFFPKCFTF